MKKSYKVFFFELFWGSKTVLFEFQKQLFGAWSWIQTSLIYVHIYICANQGFAVSQTALKTSVFESQKPKTPILESQKQLVSKLFLKLKKTIKNTKKVSFVSCFEIQKELCLRLKNYFFDTVFETEKSLIFCGFCIVLSSFHFFGPLKSN